MKIVIQRVTRASVSIAGELHSAIGPGMMVLVGVAVGDTEANARYLAAKTAALSIGQTGGRILAVSQFTLLAATRKGNRPSYINAMKGDEAKAIYQAYCTELERLTGHAPATGVFGADMQVELVNDGPVTIIIDTDENR